MIVRIDSHQHFWRYNPADYDWLSGDLAVLRRDFLPAHLTSEMQAADVVGTVAVQARQQIQETDWLLDLAADNPGILGVVGWLPLRDPGFPALLDLYGQQKILKGLRHVLQAEPAGFMDDPSFNNGMAALRHTGLTYDILVLQRQLQEATRFVDRHPDQTFVLDHLAKPFIAAGQMQPWASQIQEMSRRPNVVCKISGMVTEADLRCWSADQLKPYFDIVLECFTPARMMAGSDWPVLRAGCSYKLWWQILSGWVAVLSPDEQSEILGGTATRTYRLTPQADKSK